MKNDNNNDIYFKLLEAVEKLPKEAVERASKEITRKGYDTVGYQYQFLVNVMNEVLGLGNWGFNYLILKEAEGKWANGKGFWEITCDVKVWIEDGGKKIEFNCVGGHKAELHSDALKGAITNGFKKTLAFFGVGKKAYEGTIDDDYRPLPQPDKKIKNLTTNVQQIDKFCNACGEKALISRVGKEYCPNWEDHKSRGIKYTLQTKNVEKFLEGMKDEIVEVE